MICRLMHLPLTVSKGVYAQAAASLQRVWSRPRERPSGQAPEAVAVSAVSLPPRSVQVPRPATEAEVVATVIDYLHDLFGPAERVRWATEMRTHGRSRADILIVADEDLIAIEVKLTDWRRALGQAALNRSVVNLSYVAMWSGRISQDLLAHAAAEGIGVLGVSPTGLSVLVSPQRGRPDPTIRRALMTRLADATLAKDGNA